MKRFFIALPLLVFAAACASVSPIAPKVERIERPNIGEATIANIGDTVLEKGIRYTYPALNLSAPLSKSPGLTSGYEIPAQRLPAAFQDDNYTYYSADRMLLVDLLLGASATYGGICVSRDDPERVGVYFQTGSCPFRIESGLVQPTTVTAEMSPGFVQQLIYNGRVGNYLKFLYREFSQDIARPAFSQEVQYDLEDGNEIGFQDARIEVLSATNTELRYRVIQSFPEQ